MGSLWQSAKGLAKEAGLGGWLRSGRGAAGAALKAGWNNTYGRAGMIGAGVGATHGAVSDDTSVLGGAMMGGVLGAGGMAGLRYGRAGLYAGLTGQKGNRWAATRGAMSNRMGRDVRDFHNMGTTLNSNLGFRRITSTVKGWTGAASSPTARNLP